MPLLIIAVVLFVTADILLRYFLKRQKERRVRREREAALAVSLRLDFSREALTLKRTDVEHPKARILCVDDESVVLDSLRKILVLDGYSVDTVQTGQEVLGIIQSHHYDFVFVDLKMPAMNGEDVVKAVNHLRPDIDIVVLTGYATVESAVECMKFGVIDYVQKPFTEDELLGLMKKLVFQRQDRIQQQLKPRVHVTQVTELGALAAAEFAIPGGVFISEGHCWASTEQDGSVKVGIDDFAKKIIGRVDDIEFPNLGMQVQCGQPLFSIRQGERTIPFVSPFTGRITMVNKQLRDHLDTLEVTSYDRNWVCIIDAEDLDADLRKLKIGRAAVSFFQSDIDQFMETMRKTRTGGNGSTTTRRNEETYQGLLENLDEKSWGKFVSTFFKR
ncbi:MAG TPA: response regulator [Bacteroidota bacterium]|nr:response regulator [Bacteroidota bacterium]